jgi:hypothetical protein
MSTTNDAELDKEIQAAIDNAMPRMVGDRLRQQLAELETLRAENKNWLESYQEEQRTNNVLRQELGKHAALDTRERSLTEREKKLEEAKLALAEREAKLTADVANACADTYEKVFDKVFGNTIIRENVARSTTVPMPNGSYGGYTHAPSNESVTTTRETA